MENLFSFKYIKLGASFVFLLVSSIIPGIGQYMLLVLGGVFLMTAFASLGNSNYRGFPTKSGYKIARLIGATLLMLGAACRINLYFAIQNSVNYYATVVDIALIAYLFMFKPSSTSTVQKILKTVGYFLILISVNTLQSVKVLVNHYTYTEYEIRWGHFILLSLLLVSGIVFIIFGNRDHD